MSRLEYGCKMKEMRERRKRPPLRLFCTTNLLGESRTCSSVSDSSKQEEFRDVSALTH